MKKILVLVVLSLFLITSAAFAGSDIKGAVVNESDVKGGANVAVGKDNKANMGSVNIKNSKVKGAVVNKSNVKGGANVAVGKGNEANMGSVNVK